jgi:hypothetical protein
MRSNPSAGTSTCELHRKEFYMDSDGGLAIIGMGVPSEGNAARHS